MWGEKARRMSLGWRQALTLSIPSFGDRSTSFDYLCTFWRLQVKRSQNYVRQKFYRWVNISRDDRVSPKPSVKQKIQSFSLFKIWQCEREKEESCRRLLRGASLFFYTKSVRFWVCRFLGHIKSLCIKWKWMNVKYDWIMSKKALFSTHTSTSQCLEGLLPLGSNHWFWGDSIYAFFKNRLYQVLIGPVS